MHKTQFGTSRGHCKQSFVQKTSDPRVDNMQNVAMMIKYKDSTVPSLSLLSACWCWASMLQISTVGFPLTQASIYSGMSDNMCTWKESYPWALCIDVNTVGQHDLNDCLASAINRVPHWHALLHPQWQCKITPAGRVQSWCTTGDCIHSMCHVKCAQWKQEFCSSC